MYQYINLKEVLVLFQNSICIKFLYITFLLVSSLVNKLYKKRSHKCLFYNNLWHSGVNCLYRETFKNLKNPPSKCLWDLFSTTGLLFPLFNVTSFLHRSVWVWQRPQDAAAVICHTSCTITGMKKKISWSSFQTRVNTENIRSWSKPSAQSFITPHLYRNQSTTNTLSLQHQPSSPGLAWNWGWGGWGVGGKLWCGG